MVLFSGVYMKMCDCEYVAYGCGYIHVCTCLCGMGTHECGSAYVCVLCVCVGVRARTPKCLGLDRDVRKVSPTSQHSGLSAAWPWSNHKEGKWEEKSQMEAGGGWEKVLGPAHKSNSPRQRSLSNGRCRKSQ